MSTVATLPGIADMGLLGTGFLFAGLFGASFFFSGTETAYFSLQGVDKQRFEKGGIAEAQVLRLLRRDRALLSSILLGNEVVNVSIAAVGAALLTALDTSGPLHDLLHPLPWLKPLINVLVIWPALLILSEITPKVIAFRYNTSWSKLVAWPLTAFYYAIFPIRVLVTLLVSRIAWLVGVRGPQASDAMAEVEIRVMLRAGEESGDVNEREREIIEAVFEFDEHSVGQLMTPRPDIFAVPLDIAWADLLEAAKNEGISRIPVYEGGIDNLVGVLLFKDLLKYKDRPPAGPRQLRSILVAPTFVPLSKPADNMLREFMERRFHMAFVVDEHGTLVGLVTLDDLLSELVGEMLDPEDGDEGPDLVTSSPGVMTVRGGMDVDDFADETGIVLPEGEYKTIGGYVFHVLGRLPATGDVVEYAQHKFEVTEMDDRRLVALRFTSDGHADDDDLETEEAS